MPIEQPELFMSVVVPAYNEEERLEGMLEEAVEFLEREYGAAHGGEKATGKDKGWEILIVSDGSKDKTVEKALEFAKEHQLSQHPAPKAGPWSKNGDKKTPQSTHIPHGSIRVITLEENRGKGGAVTHGMRHVRGQYIVFADADGASRFDDLGKMVEGCRKVEDKDGRAVAIGSRAHLVGSEAVVKVRFYSSILLGDANHFPALKTSQLSHALLPYSPPRHDTTSDRSYQGYPVWFQAFFATLPTLHHPVYALRRLDLRCGDAHAG
jgi:glycosyltransferase involved in cell wall biosynthesis